MANILIVDDEKDMRLALSRVLTRNGHKAEESADGPSALARIKKGGLDLVLLDFRLPGMDGLEILDKIRETHADLPVIMVTGYGSVDSAVEVMERGASHYLAKPFSNKELIETVTDTLKGEQPPKEPAGVLRKRLADKVAGNTSSPESSASKTPASASEEYASPGGFGLGLAAALLGAMALGAVFLTRVDEVKDFKIPYSHPSALTWSGDSLWTADWLSQTIYQHKLKDGKLMTVRTVHLKGSHITGLAIAQGTIYIADSWKKTIERRRMDKNLSLIDSVKSPGPKPSGLHWDGRYLWSSDTDRRRFYQHDLDDDLTVLSSYKSPGKTPSAMFKDTHYFWSTDADTRVLYKHRLDSKLRVMASYSLPDLEKGTHALSAFTWKKGKLWIAREGVGHILRRPLSEFKKHPSKP